MTEGNSDIWSWQSVASRELAPKKVQITRVVLQGQKRLFWLQRQNKR